MEVHILPVGLFYVAASLVFTPFVHKVSKLPLLKSVWFSFVLQAISMASYVILFTVINGFMVMIQRKPVSITLVLIPTFLASLFIVFPIASLSARKLLLLTDDEQTKVVRNGNVVVATLFWILLWIAPF
jgi:hypothetical protein